MMELEKSTIAITEIGREMVGTPWKILTHFVNRRKIYVNP